MCDGMCTDSLSGSQRIKSQTSHTERKIFQVKEMANKRPLTRTGGMGSQERPLAKIKNGVRSSHQEESYLETRRQNNMVEAWKYLGQVSLEET